MHSQNEKGKRYINSPCVKPFTPTQHYGLSFNDRLMKSGSTATSELISEEDYMISPMPGRSREMNHKTSFEK